MIPFSKGRRLMYFTDNHVHSLCSPDGHNTMTEMMRASYDAGVRHMCFTDHCDMDDYLTGEPDPECFSFRGEMNIYFEQACAAKPEDMEICLGLELGECNHDPVLASRIASSDELDFVLGSLHNIKGTMDFYEMEYPDEPFCRDLLDKYMDELIDFSKLDCFDVMAHIGYPVRYIRKAGFSSDITVKSHGDRIKALLKTLIENGKGIEINCAGYRNKYLNDSVPAIDVLRMYKDLGGEIITVGSDAHRTVQAGSGLDRGFDILDRLGYKYVTVFEHRKPKFLKLDGKRGI